MTTARRRRTWQAPKQWDALPHTMFPTLRTLAIIGSGVLLGSGLVGVGFVIGRVTA